SHGRIWPRRGHKQRRGNPPETTTLLVRRDVPTFERNGVPFWMRQLLFRHARRIPNKGDSPNNSRMGEGRTYHNRSNSLDEVQRESWVSRGMASRLIKSPGEDRILTAFAL